MRLILSRIGITYKRRSSLFKGNPFFICSVFCVVMTSERRLALITGITGQDGSYLAELLIEKDYKVYGLVRRHSSINTQRIDHLYENSNLRLLYGDMTDQTSLFNVFNTIFTENRESGFDRLEVYNLAAQSHVKVSFEVPEYTGQTDALGVLRLLEVIRHSDFSDKIRFYQASTSELFGEVLETPQKETTPFNPRSPYAVAKLYGCHIVKNYRESYGMFACNGILFNHTSPRRGETFVERKISIAVGKMGSDISEKSCLYLGNLNACRDIGHARDYVRGMWLMLQQEKPEDYVLATGVTKSVRQIVEAAFAVLGHKIEWEGEGINEVGKINGQVVVRVSPKYFRPAEVDLLLGDATKAKIEIGWEPTVSFEEIMEELVQHDLH